MNTEYCPFIVALDVPSVQETLRLIDELSGLVDIFKVGSQLFTACGPEIVREIILRKKKVFLDLKYHDIPSTVAGAVRSAIYLSAQVYKTRKEKFPADQKKDDLLMFTVHIQGGREMLQSEVKAAREAAKKQGVRRPWILGVPMLTSMGNEDNIQKQFFGRALMAKEAGMDGAIVSACEVLGLRREEGEEFLLITPGIRPRGTRATMKGQYSVFMTLSYP